MFDDFNLRTFSFDSTDNREPSSSEMSSSEIARRFRFGGLIPPFLVWLGLGRLK